MGALLLGSGTCALVYQVIWFRELRLVFGSSTAANAATLAIFMAGLGLGSAVLGVMPMAVLIHSGSTAISSY